MLTSSLNASEHHRAARHIQFIADSHKVNCYRPADLIRNYEDACFFVHNTYTCDDKASLVDYLQFIVCDLKIDKSFLGCTVLLIITALLLSIYVSFMYVNVTFFIAPNLEMLIENMNIDEYYFGLIVISVLLVFPDFLKELFVCGTNESITLLITALVGKTLSVFTFGIITLSIRGSFKLNKINFSINLFLLIAGNVCVAQSVHYKVEHDNLAKDNKGFFSIELISILLFVTYCIYICLGMYISFRKKRMVLKSIQELELNNAPKQTIEIAKAEAMDAGLLSDTESYHATIAVPQEFSIFRLIIDIINRYMGYILTLLGFRTNNRTNNPTDRSTKTDKNVDRAENQPTIDIAQQSTSEAPTTTTTEKPKKSKDPKDLSEWKLFLHALNPYDNIQNAPSFLLVVISPIWYLMALSTPVIDKNRPQHGWSKYTVVISILLFPVSMYYSSFGISALGLFISEGCAIFCTLIILIVTKGKRRPRYLTPFAIVGVLSGFTIFTIFDNEVDTITNQLLIYLWDWERDTIELLLTPLNFILAECIISWRLLKSNHNQAAYGFIIGVTMISTFMVLPSITFKVCYAPDTRMVLTDSTSTAYIYLILILIFILFGVAMTNFVLRWAHAIFLIIVISAFFMFMMFAEGDHIHAFGTKHSIFLLLDKAHAKWA